MAVGAGGVFRGQTLARGIAGRCSSARRCPGAVSWTGIYLVDLHERWGGRGLLGRLAAQGHRRGRPGHRVSLRPCVEVQSASVGATGYQGPPHSQHRQDAGIRQRCPRHCLRVREGQQGLHSEAAWSWQSGPGIPHGRGRQHVPSMLLRVCHDDSACPGCLLRHGLRLV